MFLNANITKIWGGQMLFLVNFNINNLAAILLSL